MFRAVHLRKTDAGVDADVRLLSEDRLPEGDVRVAVEYSTINYKDGLAITGRFPVVRSWPMVPGIDLAGTVAASDSPRFRPGDRVLVNGYGLGDAHWGGLAQQARVRSEWLIPVPAVFTTRQAMAIGTAGYTAMLCVLALEHQGLRPDQGPVLVTGAAGGVGCVAIALLARLGYEVTASTGRPAEADFLRGLGARQVIDRATLAAPGEMLGAETWAGAVDTVGSATLAHVCAAMKYRGAVAACGLAQGLDFPTSVLPYILRNVTLCGIDSVMAPHALRVTAWQRLARDLDIDRLDAITQVRPLDAAIAAAPESLAGRVRGRLVIDVNR
ncbi:MAG TPA: MDR family oxidoreductase [Methylibium sp.]|nr:MDR family oxidoreductase [Methylibium sp.]